ncbi:MAG: ribose-phosphate diphosphokinase [Alphaproteobacteria bacterium]
MQNKISILSSKKYNYIKKEIIKNNENFINIEIEAKKFPDGENFWRFNNAADIKNKPAVLICGTIDNDAIFELYNLASSLVRENCSALHIVIPYFGYSTMEHALKPGDVVTTKNISHLISSIPQAPFGNFVYLVNLHSVDTQYYFENNTHTIHINTENILDEIISRIKTKEKNVVLASADMGRAKWIERTSSRLNMPSAYIMKKRISGEKTSIEGINADVKNKTVVICDDMIRSGGSILDAVQAYKSMGAKKIYIICIHGVFTKGSIEKLENSKIIEKIYCTNTHSKTQTIKSSLIEIVDITKTIKNNLQI